eukprot:jgi/Mesen1/2790/ME000170S01892
MFTVSVYWIPTEQKWATRWDALLDTSPAEMELSFFSLLNSIIVALCLSGIVAMVMINVLKKDIAVKEQQLLEIEGGYHGPNIEAGWKHVTNDVFRTPRQPHLLSILVGTGTQLAAIAMAILLLAAFGTGYFSPADRGHLMSTAFVIFAFLGIAAGYGAAKVFSICQGKEAVTVVVGTALFLPGIFFSLFLLLNFAIWAAQSAGAVPFGSLCKIGALWFGISAPLVFLGGHLAMSPSPVQYPVKTNNIQRRVPNNRPWYLSSVVLTFGGGAVVIAIISLQVFLLITKLWFHRYFYMMGFMAATIFLTALVSAEVAIIAVYMTLCCEDYHWWWLSFNVPATSGIYMFITICAYFLPVANRGSLLTVAMLLVYNTMLSLVIAILTGTIGFVATTWFVWTIYSALKQE